MKKHILSRRGNKHSMQFTGVPSQYIKVGVGTDFLPLTVTDFTICTWFKTPGVAVYPQPGGLFGVTAGGPYVQMSGRINFMTSNSTDGSISPTWLDTPVGVSYADNRWHYVVCTHINALLSIYADGLLVASTTMPVGYPGTTRYDSSAVLIGNNINYPSKRPLLGQMSDTRFYNRAISPAEVALLFRGVDISPKALLGQWKLDEGSGTIAYDSSGNGHNGTFVNAPQYIADAPNYWAITGKGATNDFIFTMRTTAVDETVTLPATGTNDFWINWGDDSALEHVITASPTHVYAVTGDHEIKISGTCPVFSFNNLGDKLKLISVSNLGKVGWTSLRGAFGGCTNMLSFVGGNTDTSNVTRMDAMFYQCYSAHTIDVSSFDTSKNTDMGFMFYGCQITTSLDVSNFDTSKVTSMYAAFNGCRSLTSIDLSGFDTSMVYTFAYSFVNCVSMTSIDVSNFNVSVLTTAADMFLNSDFNNENYDAMLLSWSAQTLKPNVLFHAGSAKYSEAAARAILTDAPNSWTITDGGSV